MQSSLPTAPLLRAESVLAPPQLPSGAPHIVTRQRTDLDTQQEDQWESEGGLVGRSPDASQTPGRSLSTKAGSWRDDGYWTTGTILSLRAGGFGFIASDASGRPWALRFHAAAVMDDQFSRLRVGGRVQFRQVRLPGDPSRVRAVQVSSIA